MVSGAISSYALSPSSRDSSRCGTVDMSKEASAPGPEDNCVLCCHVSEVWVYGECNHPICLVCCARMRVLCDQNDCPVCRLSLNQVGCGLFHMCEI